MPRPCRRAAPSSASPTALHITGYLDDADLEGLWREAACFAFPTRGEGFGLPLLEAMQRGVPAAASDIPVLREVSGGVAHHFDPDDPQAAARAVTAAIADAHAARARTRAGRAVLVGSVGAGHLRRLRDGRCA